MSYIKAIEDAIQDSSPKEINMHPLTDGTFIMEINYTKMVVAIINELDKNGYVIMRKVDVEKQV
jgi:hypothetical protein